MSTKHAYAVSAKMERAQLKPYLLKFFVVLFFAAFGAGWLDGNGAYPPITDLVLLLGILYFLAFGLIEFINLITRSLGWNEFPLKLYFSSTEVPDLVTLQPEGLHLHEHGLFAWEEMRELIECNYDKSGQPISLLIKLSGKRSLHIASPRVKDKRAKRPHLGELTERLYEFAPTLKPANLNLSGGASGANIEIRSNSYPVCSIENIEFKEFVREGRESQTIGDNFLNCFVTSWAVLSMMLKWLPGGPDLLTVFIGAIMLSIKLTVQIGELVKRSGYELHFKFKLLTGHSRKKTPPVRIKLSRAQARAFARQFTHAAGVPHVWQDGLPA